MIKEKNYQNSKEDFAICSNLQKIN